MEMTGEYRIEATQQKVWEALNDPEVLRETIPGCQSIEKISATEMTAKVKSKIGPVSATFVGTVTLSNLDPPKGYTISGEGKGGVAGFARGGADVRLREEGKETVLHYTAKAQVGGKLAQIGGRIVDAAAKQMADAFFGAFAERLGAGKEAEAVEADVENDPEVFAEALEERAEVAAGNNFLGGPYIWGLLALIAVIALIMVLS